eukprot:2654638-Alexandrium_andersonii.AAC.1
MSASLVGSEMCIRDSIKGLHMDRSGTRRQPKARLTLCQYAAIALILMNTRHRHCPCSPLRLYLSDDAC